MSTETTTKNQLKTDLPEIRPGDTIRVHQKIALSEGQASSAKESSAKKERIQVFEGQVIARKHGKGISSTITVRRVISGIGIEKIFSLHSPTIDKIEVVKKAKPRRAKLYFLRTAKGKRAKLKREEIFKK